MFTLTHLSKEVLSAPVKCFSLNSSGRGIPGISIYLNFWRKVKVLIKKFPSFLKSLLWHFSAMGFFCYGIWSLIFCHHSPLGKRHFPSRSSLGFYQDRKCISVQAFKCLEWISCLVQVQFHFIINLTHSDHLVSEIQNASHQLSNCSSTYSGLQITLARRKQRNNSLQAYLSTTTFSKR